MTMGCGVEGAGWQRQRMNTLCGARSNFKAGRADGRILAMNAFPVLSFLRASDRCDEGGPSLLVHSSPVHACSGLERRKDTDTMSSSRCGSRMAATLHKIDRAQPTKRSGGP